MDTISTFLWSSHVLFLFIFGYFCSWLAAVAQLMFDICIIASQKCENNGLLQIMIGGAITVVPNVKLWCFSLQVSRNIIYMHFYWFACILPIRCNVFFNEFNRSVNACSSGMNRRVI